MIMRPSAYPIATLTGFLLIMTVFCHADEPVRIVAGIPPAAYLAERIGGDSVGVETLLRPGTDPHTYEPTPKELTALSTASLFFKVGMPFEETLSGKIADSFPRLKFVDLSTGIEKHAAEHEEHAHHDEHGDPHIWLSPPLLATMAKNAAAALMEAAPEHQETYKTNLDSFLQEIEAVHVELQGMLAPYKGQTFYVFHPAFGYFADAYGLKQKAVETGGKSPAPKDLAALIKQAKAEQVRVIFVQPQFAGTSAAAIADGIGGTVVPMDDLAPDVLHNLRNMAAQISKALSP